MKAIRPISWVMTALLLGAAVAPPRAPAPCVAADGGRAAAAPDTVLRSERWPPVGVAVDTAFRHLGTATLDLGNSTAEIHLLVDADGGHAEVRRFYWIQFEGRSPGRPSAYDYSDLPHRDTIDGYVFHTDVRYGAYTADEVANEPDTGTVGAILSEHGYGFPAPMMRARMVTLDGTRRNELLVIYMEALDWSGTTLPALEADPAAWAEASAGLRERATGGLGLVPGG